MGMGRERERGTGTGTEMETEMERVRGEEVEKVMERERGLVRRMKVGESLECKLLQDSYDQCLPSSRLQKLRCQCRWGISYMRALSIQHLNMRSL